MKRSAGILLSVSSLPSKYGIGCFSEAAYKFVDWLKEAGQTYWQILPLGPTSYGDSPYQSFSTFAGNPYFISLEEFVNQGLLTREECNAADFESNIDKVDYEKLYKSRYALLHKAYEKCDVEKNADFLEFCRKNEWIEDYALFMAIKDKCKGTAWSEWEEDIRLRKTDALKKYSDKLRYEVNYYKLYMSF